MKKLAAVAARDGDNWIVKSPSPGVFVPAIARGELVSAGRVLGELDVLGRRAHVIAPDVHGVASSAIAAPRAVSYGEALVVIEPIAAERGAASETAAAADAAGLVFRAPTSGRCYLRSAPGKPPFVAVGAELAAGATICLLEVMKTFHRVTYGGPGLPERARVREVLVADGADVDAGAALVALDPA